MTAARPTPTLRQIDTNGISMRIAEAGSGPLVVLLHGWPESWFSWRHQLPALAEAGYHAVAPDLRGYGGSDAPEAVEEYDVHHHLADFEGLLAALGEDQAIVVGHDWGSILAWNFALLAPERVSAVCGMSVPYTGRGPVLPTEGWRDRFGENFFYILYFQEPGVAEAEFDGDPEGILLQLYGRSADASGEPTITDPRRAAGGMIGRSARPDRLPPWLTQEEFDYYVDEFKRSGFRGGINFYRNFDRNWLTTEHLEGRRVEQPALFIAGENDGVIAMFGPRMQARMRETVPNIHDLVFVPEAGHWVQQERPAEVNSALLAWLGTLR